jgi:hypothetical protein
MADYIVSADAGNGGTNVIMAKKNGGYKRFYEPSVRAIATGDSLGLGKDFEVQYEYVDWYGSRYVTGDDVIRVTRRGVERHMCANRYGDDFHQFLVANDLARMGVKKVTVDLTLFEPPGLFASVKDEIIQRFMEHDGVVQIKLKGDRKPREWQYSAVNVWPEGMGAAMCFAVDDTGTVVNDDLLRGDAVILDVGAFTLDALKLTNGDFNPENLEHATWQNAGVNTHVREPLLRMLQKRDPDFSVLTVDDIDAVLRRGFMEDNFTLEVAGKEINLGPVVEGHIERYADWIANNIIDGVFDGFRGIKVAILVGGGAGMVADKIHYLYGTYDPSKPNKDGKVLNPKKHNLTRKVHPVDMNAVGGLRFAIMRQKQGDPAG